MNSPEFLSALVDTLVPGGPVADGISLPSASSVRCGRMLAEALAREYSSLLPLMATIAANAGGANSFAMSEPSARTSALQTIATEEPQKFAELVALTLSHYYAQPEVLTALQWPARPPQPEGHALLPFDETLLEPVRARGALWRSV